jgi:hypothetical protein
MDSLPIGSAQSWLAVAATTLGPLIALIVGFEGANWFLRRKLVRPAITRQSRSQGQGQLTAEHWPRSAASLAGYDPPACFADNQSLRNHSTRK